MELSQAGLEYPEKKSAVLHKPLIDLLVPSNKGRISKYYPAATNITSILWSQTNGPSRLSCFQWWQQEILFKESTRAWWWDHASVLSQHQQWLDCEYLKVYPYCVILISTLSHLWIWLAPFWPCWCHLPLLPHGAQSPRLSPPTAYLFLVLNWRPTNFTECHQILHWWTSVQIQLTHTLRDFINLSLLSQFIWQLHPQVILLALFVCTLSCVFTMWKTHVMNSILLKNCLQEWSYKIG